MLLYPEPMKTITYSVVGVLVLIVGTVIYDRAAVRYADVDEAYTCLTLDAERTELDGSDLPDRESYIELNAAERKYRRQCIGPVTRWWANLTDPIPARPKPSCLTLHINQLDRRELEAELNRLSATYHPPHPDGLDVAYEPYAAEAYEAYAATGVMPYDLNFSFFDERRKDLETQLEADRQRLQEDPAADPMEQYYLVYQKELAIRRLRAWLYATRTGREDLRTLTRWLENQPPGCRGIPFYLYETET